jgi:hypothetical protein
MTIRPGIRTSTRDRERAIEVIKDGFVEGRLTREEFDERVERAFVSRTFAELTPLTDDLPASPLLRLPAVYSIDPRLVHAPRESRLAAVSVTMLLLCWLAVLVLLASVH